MSKVVSRYRIPFRFTAMPSNFIDDGWIFELPHKQLKILIYVLRVTWGFQKEAAPIALFQFVKKTRLSLATIKRELRKLRDDGILSISGPRNGVRTYKIVLSRRLTLAEPTDVVPEAQYGELPGGSAGELHHRQLHKQQKVVAIQPRSAQGA